MRKFSDSISLFLRLHGYNWFRETKASLWSKVLTAIKAGTFTIIGMSIVPAIVGVIGQRKSVEIFQLIN